MTKFSQFFNAGLLTICASLFESQAVLPYLQIKFQTESGLQDLGAPIHLKEFTLRIGFNSFRNLIEAIFAEIGKWT